jgi:hypothetical protein
VYHDPIEDRYYASRRDYERITLHTKIQRGELRPIEGFSRYTITPEGLVVNIQRARQVKPHMNSTGRLTIGLISDQNEQRTLGLARLIGKHFYGLPDDQYYDAVHKDGDLMNVHPDNLVFEARWRRHADPNNYGIDI